jgi:hypothetical protein
MADEYDRHPTIPDDEGIDWERILASEKALDIDLHEHERGVYHLPGGVTVVDSEATKRTVYVRPRTRSERDQTSTRRTPSG